MKKTLMGLAVLAMSLMPAMASAQTQSSNASDQTSQENVMRKSAKKQKGDRKIKCDGKKAKCDANKAKCDGKKAKCEARKVKCDGKKRFANERGRMLRRDGRAYADSVNMSTLNLSAEQKSKVKALNDARRVSAQEIRAKARQARQTNDTSYIFDDTEIQELQSKYLKDLRVILTSDQYVEFLENNYMNGGKPQMRNHAYMHKSGKGLKHNRMIKPAKKVAYLKNNASQSAF